MWTHYPELLQRAVPRYTSYPTAADFSADVSPESYGEALRTVPEDAALSLYVHIPFCEEICWYCGCNTARANKRSRLSTYLDALRREIAMVAQELGGRGRVRRISFGGGSPNALDPVDFVRLLCDLTLAFKAQNPVISIEIDPRRFTPEWLQVIHAARISHVSLGVQTFDPAIQAAIGRIQPLVQVQTLADDLRDAGVTSLNFDLMYGLPGQTREGLLETLHQAADMAPDRIALFGYAHMPHLIPRQRRIDTAALPGEAERFAMACIGHDFLVDEGYQPIGFDHFAKPGDPLSLATREERLHRNFQGFTDDDSPWLIGLGASAISQFPGLYAQNAKNAGVYRTAIDGGRFATERGVVRTAQDRYWGGIIDDLLCKGHAHLPESLTPEQDEHLREFAGRGLVTLGSETIALRPEAAPYARTIAALFDPRMAHKVGRFSAPV